MTFGVKKFIKKFNGSAVYHKPKKKLSVQDIKEICNGSKIADGETAEELIHDARTEKSQS